MKDHSLYPLRFRPQFKQRIWGGSKIREHLHPQHPIMPSCGESWELSEVPGSVSVVSEGPCQGETLSALIKRHKEKLLGGYVFEKYGSTFPLLVKFIDAHEDLSVQVHPDDATAHTQHQSRGKAEMWYILEAAPAARIFTGFEKALSRSSFLQLVDQNRLLDALHSEDVQAEDVFYIPPGRIHSAGKGILFAEIQETSDITYRIYDFQRQDANKKPRTLHLEEAMRVLDFTPPHEPKTRYPRRAHAVTRLIHCPYFSTNKLSLQRPLTRDLRKLDSFVIYLCTAGQTSLESPAHSLSLQKGTCVLLPAAYEKKYTLSPQTTATLLECYLAP